MIGALRHLLPKTIAGQVFLLVLVSVISANIIVATTFMVLRAHEPGTPGERSGMIIALADLLDASPPDQRPVLIDRFLAREKEFHIDLVAKAERPTVTGDLGGIELTLSKRFTAWQETLPTPGGTMVIRLSDGMALRIQDHDALTLPPMVPEISTLALFTLSIAIFGSWAVLTITSPLRRFIRAVEDLGDDVAGPDFPEEGPREVRATISAVNRLRHRVTRLIDSNRQTMAAVSHDLRTPITRLRLRAEFVEDPALREPMLADIAHMSQLTTSALSYLRDRPAILEKTLTDLPSLIQTICDQSADVGANIDYRGPQRLALMINALDIQRAVTNLVENAVKHADHVAIELGRDEDDMIRIDVIDDGPGIAAGDRQHLMQPFVRGDNARDPDAGTGFGLGLSITAAIAEAHGGSLELLDAEPSGLKARIRLPAQVA